MLAADRIAIWRQKNYSGIEKIGEVKWVLKKYRAGWEQVCGIYRTPHIPK